MTSSLVPFRNAVLVLLVLALASAAAAGPPVHDPFVEKFTVGTWDHPHKVVLVEGFPAELLVPVKLDTAWTSAAGRVLGRGRPQGPLDLLEPLLEHQFSAEQASEWQAHMLRQLENLEAGRSGTDRHPFLLPERMSRAAFLALEQGKPGSALSIANDIRRHGDSWGMDPREIFVWELRYRHLVEVTGEIPFGPAPFWPSMLNLGPFDSGNGWAIWVAHRQARQHPIMPARHTNEKLGRFLGGVSQAWITPEDLYNSSFSAGWISGLGALLLETKDLPAHFRRYPNPPGDFELQGWWVRGQRFSNRGEAPAYEKLAARTDLNAGWRMDVWRRASEVRLLDGSWDTALQDLQKALDLARARAGTQSLRRRLRQWNEQALVLALAEGDIKLARRIHTMGMETWSGEELEVYVMETMTWQDMLAPEDSDAAIRDLADGDSPAEIVARGQAPDVRAAPEVFRSQFEEAADAPLWDLWFHWGRSLAQVGGLDAGRQARADIYAQFMTRGLAVRENQAKREEVIAAVASRLKDHEIMGSLLIRAVELETNLICRSSSPLGPSPVPGLLEKTRNSQLDMHALLGFALVSGDMRGILAVAAVLPGTGLSREEKMLFLYPLPAQGSIRNAILGAENDPSLLLAVARNESLFDPAVRSQAGALGWMQIMPFHYPGRGAGGGRASWRQPSISIGWGDRLLTENRKRYDGDPYRTLAAYNAGPGAAGRWMEQLGGQAERSIYLAWIGYPETRYYVEKVLIDRLIYDGIIREIRTRQ